MARPTSPSANHPTDRLLGDSVGIRELRAYICHLATFDTIGNPHVPTLLIQGETGTGKGLIARIVHDSGPRASGPFVGVNCAAIPESLLEAEVFGFEAGAFTDAKHSKSGLFEAASGGALFLDEIDALPLSLQSKLLTVVEEKRVRRLGAVTDRAVDVKLIVATQRDLLASVDGGRFRADLYHRLAVVVLTVPPLRERGDDIITLAQHFLQHYAAAHHLRPKQLSAAANVWLRNAHWPGNVRELSHLMERVTLLSPEEDLDLGVLEHWSMSGAPPAPRSKPETVKDIEEVLDEPERIRQALLRTGGNITRAAQLLDLSRKALRYRLRRYGIERPDREGWTPPPSPSAGHAPPLSFPLVGEETDRRSIDDTTLPSSLASPARGEGEVVSGDASRVGSVGRSVPGQSSGWEQRTVAVLAIEMTLPESTHLTGSSHEPWMMTSRWEEMLADKIQEFGGVFLRRSLPLLVAGFGLPRSLEQMPHRAVQAALTIGRMVKAALLAADKEPCPEVRQAVHLGPVLVDMAASDPIMRLPAVGDTLALPMRLLGHAAPGEILISPQAARLVEGIFALQARELLTGKPDVTMAYSVAGLRRRQPAGGPAVRTHGLFVGRERELAILHDLLTMVEGGRGQVVGLFGEPGMGKSRLLWEFRRQLAEPRVTYLEGRCFAYGLGIPYLPILEILRQHFGVAEVDPPETVAEKVCCGLQSEGMDPEAGAPYLLHMLGIKQGVDRVASLTPAAIKARTFETLCQLSLNASRRQPLVLAIEDIHWIDNTSAEYVTSLAERLAGAPILLLYTYRPGYQPAWMHNSYATHLSLKPLPPRDSLCVVQSVLRTEQIPDALVQAILAKAEGNPFFLEELAQNVTNRRELRSSPELPETIQVALMARIDGLAEASKQLVQTMAVVGSPCPISLLTRISGQPVDELQRLLSTLQRRELLYEQPAIPEPKYFLKHALIQEVAYYSLPVERRRELHERIAQAIEALYQDRLDEDYGAQAVVYLQWAGKQALQRSANPEAVRHLTTALELLTMFPDTPARARQELDLQIALGPALMAIKGPGALDVEQAYTRAMELCEQIGETPQLFPALIGLWRHYQLGAEQETARILGERLLHLAQRQDDAALLMMAHRALGQTLFFLGDLTLARGHLEQGLTFYNPQHRSLAIRYGTDPGVPCLYYAAHTLWLLGYPERAREHVQTMLALARDGADRFSIASSLFYAARLYLLRREKQAAGEQIEALMRLSTEQGFRSLVVYGTILQGSLFTALGQRDEGMTLMRQGLAAHREVGTEAIRPMLLALLAAAYEGEGPAEAGLHVVDEALTLVERYGVRYYEAELYRLKGTFLSNLANADVRQAEACFQHALGIAQRQQAKAWELRAVMSLMRLWYRQGKREVGRQQLHEVYRWFTEGFDTADLREANALLHVPL
jgi:DNA-binding NtrC family response regulator/predicted ATPase